MMYSNYFIDSLRDSRVNGPVLYDGDQYISAKELLDSSFQIAHGLKERGVKKGDKAVIVVKPGIEFLQIMYANMMIGTVISIIDPEMGRDNYRAKLMQFAPNHAFVDSKLVLLNEHPLLKYLILKLNRSVPSFPRMKKCRLWTSGGWLPLIQRHTRIASLKREYNEPIYFGRSNEMDDFLITYTSGTVSEPKGVVHSYFSLASSIKHLTELLKANLDVKIATHLPHYALLGINAGIQVYLWDHQMDVGEKVKFIRDNHITTLFGPPSDFVPFIEYFTLNNESLPECIKNIYLGSAPIYTSFLSHLIPQSGHVKITCLYGMTENLMVAIQDGREKLKLNLEGDLVGTPFPDLDISIEEDGEICIYSDQLFSGYWQMGERSKAHHTGDIGTMDPHGRLILLGRKKDMIIRGNFNIYPGLYEPTITKIKGVKEAVMIGIYDSAKSDEEVVLVIHGADGLKSEDIMKQLVSGKYSIDKEAIPNRIVFMKIPHSGRHQKVDRKRLAEILKASI